MRLSTNTVENTALRLKAVLDILAESVWSGETLGGGKVLSEAIARVPLNDRESELLAGGVPRGHKVLTTATSKLVKAGWLVKNRGGWTITDDGLRATVAFPDAESLAEALAAGTLVPADLPVPTAPHAVSDAEDVSIVEAVVAEAVTEAVAEAAEPAVQTAVESDDAAHTEALPQPAAVAVAGDFSTKLGAPADWEPHFDEVQMSLDPADFLWKLTVDLPAGSYSYKVALNRSWDENYGAFGHRGGANHELHHPGGKVTFRYDHRTRDVVTG